MKNLPTDTRATCCYMQMLPYQLIPTKPKQTFPRSRITHNTRTDSQRTFFSFPYPPFPPKKIKKSETRQNTTLSRPTIDDIFEALIRTSTSHQQPAVHSGKKMNWPCLEGIFPNSIETRCLFNNLGRTSKFQNTENFRIFGFSNSLDRKSKCSSMSEYRGTNQQARFAVSSR